MAETRDFIMARLAAAKFFNGAAGDAIDACLEAFVDPEDDPRGETRKETLESASDCAGEVSRSIELAQAMMDELVKTKELGDTEPELEDEEEEK